MTYRKGGYSLGVGYLPGSKRKSLYIGENYQITKVASFSNDEAADEFGRWLEFFLGLRFSPMEEEACT